MSPSVNNSLMVKSLINWFLHLWKVNIYSSKANYGTWQTMELFWLLQCMIYEWIDPHVLLIQWFRWKKTYYFRLMCASAGQYDFQFSFSFMLRTHPQSLRQETSGRLRGPQASFIVRQKPWGIKKDKKRNKFTKIKTTHGAK